MTILLRFEYYYECITTREMITGSDLILIINFDSVRTILLTHLKVLRQMTDSIIISYYPIVEAQH